ncbi:MAG: alcohol dehydrogenase catalytic domain-containing protein [Candidatus Eremiobacteraeota bacterium]|nr:alcohol dehydrogenase catalytic domain-containing protein [Candidatus Eremiobacteraeota bacterium]
MKTRAAILSEFELPRPYATSRPLSIEEIELEEPSYGEVLVRVESAGVCHSDLSTIDGILTKPVPIVLGHEAAGVVERIGPGVTTVNAGDKVVFSFVPTCGKCTPCASGKPALCEPGNRANLAADLLRGVRRFRRNGETVGHHLGVSGFSEYTVAAEESLIRVPDDVPMEIAAVFGCAALTGLGAVIHAARVLPGTSVAIFGAGGVGLMTLLGAQLVAATPIIVVDPVESKRKKALELGASAALDPTNVDPVQAILELTGGAGVDYAFEVSGVARAFEQAASAIAAGGLMVAVGIPRRSDGAQISPAMLVLRDRTLRGAFMSSAVPRRDIPRYVALWKAGKLPVEKLVSGTVGLEGLNEAMDALASGTSLRTMVCPHVMAAR